MLLHGLVGETSRLSKKIQNLFPRATLKQNILKFSLNHWSFSLLQGHKHQTVPFRWTFPWRQCQYELNYFHFLKLYIIIDHSNNSSCTNRAINVCIDTISTFKHLKMQKRRKAKCTQTYSVCAAPWVVCTSINAYIQLKKSVNGNPGFTF